MKYKRPKRIIIECWDALNNTFLGNANLPVTNNEACRKYYSGITKRMLKTWPQMYSNELGLRKPKLKVIFIY